MKQNIVQSLKIPKHEEFIQKKKNIDHEEKSQRGFDKLEYRKKNTIFKSIKLNGQCYMQ